MGQLRVALALPEAPAGANLTSDPDLGSGSLLIQYKRTKRA